MGVLILTGPSAAGKNTVATSLARKLDRCAVIDADLVRAMVVQPHRAPWEGEEGKQQQLLGVRNVRMLAESYAQAGCQVVILDVLSEETAQLYKQFLLPFRPTVVMLLPTFQEIERRDHARGRRLTAAELRMVYEQQCSFVSFDKKIDNTHLVADEVAAVLVSYLE